MKLPFIQLTNPSDQRPMFVNANHIVAFVADEQGGTKIHLGDGSQLAKETPSQILQLVQKA